MNKSVVQRSTLPSQRATDFRSQLAILERKYKRIAKPAVKKDTTKSQSESCQSKGTTDDFKPTPQDTLRFILNYQKNRSRPIIIPLAECACAVKDLGFSIRLYHVLVFNNIRTLGDLQGRDFKDIAKFRSCGATSIRELEGLVKKLQIKAGMIEEPEEVAEVVIRIPKSAQDVELSSLALSFRLGRIVGFGVYRMLGDLEGVPFKRFLEVKGCGATTIHQLFEVVSTFDMTLEHPTNPNCSTT